MMRRLGILVLALAAAIALISCTAIPPRATTNASSLVPSEGKSEMKAIYSELARGGGRVYTLDPHASTVRIYVFRGGLAARLGHNHVLAAPKFIGYFYLSPAGTSKSRFDLEFRLDQLEIDNPAYRAVLGSAFASVLSPQDIAGVRKHMLGEQNMQADRFPFVRIHSLQISGGGTKFAAKVQVEMHGQKREMWVPLDVEGLPQRLSVTGAMVLRQTDFGVHPYSVLHGLIAVQDEVVVEFHLIGR